MLKSPVSQNVDKDGWNTHIECNGDVAIQQVDILL